MCTDLNDGGRKVEAKGALQEIADALTVTNGWNYAGIAELLYECWRAENARASSWQVAGRPWRHLGDAERATWVAIAREAHRIIAAAVLA